MGNTNLLDTVSKILMNLSTNEGINASGKDESFGCIFGRDSAITILKILKAYSNKSSYTVTEMSNLMAVCRRALLTLVELQGKRKNRESGEEPGKFIHEYRKEKFERLTKRFNPWYIYPDGILRNYDSIDSTPLGLIAIYKYWDMTKDGDFLIKALPAVEKGLNWIITYGDIDKDILIEYEFHKNRKFGGLLVQSWTDSRESIKDKNGIMPSYPIAPVEAQGYAWLALKLWGDFYSDKKLVFNKNEIKGKLSATENFGRKLLKQADLIKEKFNKSFIFKDNEFNFAAQALNGDKNQITTITGKYSM
ncbi:MAG: hypothetical protein M1365_05550, partial [Actinobacteria bacterium]|nr:hypothetical protein [Actinomycetota bacterium]